MKVGYGIGMAQDQKFMRQMNALHEKGVAELFIDDCFSIKTVDDRYQMKAMLNLVNHGDEVLIPSLDSFAESEIELVYLIELFAIKGVRINFIDDDLLIGGLGISYEVALKMFRVWVRFSHKKRNSDLHFDGAQEGEKVRGRKIKLSKEQKIEAMEKFYLYSFKLKELGLEYGVSRTTLWRAINCSSIQAERTEVLIRKNILDSKRLEQQRRLNLNT